ncbi:hypothetical protein SASPL_155429 [Salvia splendens]|uniref:Uncharacterized protein n=1 Tax=Salvia splendens TaxID=180675 RepID=A0A8X8W1W0_SALSN|nr:hypothetical protein SASPL_155429 [Salvia splendens]
MGRWSGSVIPIAILQEVIESIQSETGVSFSWLELYERYQFLEQCFHAFKLVWQTRGVYWNMQSNMVISPNSAWLAMLFGMEDVKKEENTKVVVIYDTTVLIYRPRPRRGIGPSSPCVADLTARVSDVSPMNLDEKGGDGRRQQIGESSSRNSRDNRGNPTLPNVQISYEDTGDNLGRLHSTAVRSGVTANRGGGNLNSNLGEVHAFENSIFSENNLSSSALSEGKNQQISCDSLMEGEIRLISEGMFDPHQLELAENLAAIREADRMLYGDENATLDLMEARSLVEAHTGVGPLSGPKELGPNFSAMDNDHSNQGLVTQIYCPNAYTPLKAQFTKTK